MTTETKKPSETSYVRMRDDMLRSIGGGVSTGEQHRFALEWLCDEHDAFMTDVLERLAKLEYKPGNESVAALASRTNNLNERLANLEAATDGQRAERLEKLERET